MNKELISEKQAIALIVYFILNSTLIFPTALEAGRDLWIAIALSLAFSIVIISMYARILSIYSGKNLFDILEITFGKFIGRTISLIYIWFAIHLAAMVLRDFGEMFGTIIIPDTPQTIILLVISILTVWSVKEGIELLGRLSIETISFMLILLFSIVLILIPKIQINNIRPILENGSGPVIKGMLSAFAFPFGEIVIFTMILDSLNNKKKIYRVYLLGLIIGGAIIFITELNNLLIIGIEAYSSMYFPVYTVVRRAEIGNAFERIEMVGSIIVVLAGFIKIAVCTLGASKGIAKVFGYKNYRFLVTPITLLITNLAYIQFTGLIELSIWTSKYWTYYALVFQIILPIIIWIGVEIKGRSIKSNGGARGV